MENPEEVVNIPNLNSKGQLIDFKKYVLQLEKDFYTLLMELYNNVLYFKLSSNNLSLFQYIKEYKYEDILNLLSLQKTNYEDLNKIFIFFDKEITDQKVNLSENKDKKIMILKIKRVSDSKEFECDIELNESRIPNEEIIKSLTDEIYLLRKDKRQNKEIINILMEKNKQNEDYIKKLESKIKNIEDSQDNKITKKVEERIKNLNVNAKSDQPDSFPPWFNFMTNLGMMNNMNNMNNMNMNQMMNNIIPIQKGDEKIHIYFEENISRTKICIQCLTSEKIEDVKRRYFAKMCKRDEGEVFVFNTQKLENGKTIADYGLKNGSKILVIGKEVIG